MVNGGFRVLMVLNPINFAMLVFIRQIIYAQNRLTCICGSANIEWCNAHLVPLVIDGFTLIMQGYILCVKLSVDS